MFACVYVSVCTCVSVYVCVLCVCVCCVSVCLLPRPFYVNEAFTCALNSPGMYVCKYSYNLLTNLYKHQFKTHTELFAMMSVQYTAQKFSEYCKHNCEMLYVAIMQSTCEAMFMAQ